MCLLTQGPISCHKIMVSSTFHQSQNKFFKLKCTVFSAFWKTNISKVELSMIKIGQLLRKLWSLRSRFLILPPGTLTPQGIEGAMKRDVSIHLCTLQWYASRGWFIAHENWTSCYSAEYQTKHQSSASLTICAGNSPETGEFPAQTASNAENVSIWWRHHKTLTFHVYIMS